MESENILPTDAAEQLDQTLYGVRRLSNRGDIDALRTLNDIRLFRLDDGRRLEESASKSKP